MNIASLYVVLLSARFLTFRVSFQNVEALIAEKLRERDLSEEYLA